MSLFHESSFYTEGVAAGKARGRIEAERELCAAFAAKFHPEVFERVRPRIESCDDAARLKEWALAATDLSDTEYVRLLEA